MIRISITQEAYKALQLQKGRSESFSKVILRLVQSRGKLSDSYGVWKMTNEEESRITGELSKGWKRARERMTSNVRKKSTLAFRGDAPSLYP